MTGDERIGCTRRLSKRLAEIVQHLFERLDSDQQAAVLAGNLKGHQHRAKGAETENRNHDHQQDRRHTTFSTSPASDGHL